MEAERLCNGISKEQKEKQLPTLYCPAEKISIKNENEIILRQIKAEFTSSIPLLRNHKATEN